jgi:hypothetical protein
MHIRHSAEARSLDPDPDVYDDADLHWQYLNIPLLSQ